MNIQDIQPGMKLSLKRGARVVQLMHNASTNTSDLSMMTSCSHGCEKAITVIDTAGSYPTPGYGALAHLPRQLRTNNIVGRCPNGRLLYFHSDFALKHIDIDALKREEAKIVPRLALAQQRKLGAKLELDAADRQVVAARATLASLETRRNTVALHYGERIAEEKREYDAMTRVQNGIQDWRDRQRGLR